MTSSTAISKLAQHLVDTEQYLIEQSVSELEHRRAPGKWSKKEILGHLIDSGINNLQRFTEIQFSPQPYTIRPYSQDGLVKANDYQHADIVELVSIWKALNQRILKVIQNYGEVLLDYKLIIGPEQVVTLDYWIIDYVEHMEHHLKQITEETNQQRK